MFPCLVSLSFEWPRRISITETMNLATPYHTQKFEWLRRISITETRARAISLILSCLSGHVGFRSLRHLYGLVFLRVALFEWPRRISITETLSFEILVIGSQFEWPRRISITETICFSLSILISTFEWPRRISITETFRRASKD